MRKLKDKLIYFISKSKIDGLEDERNKLYKTILNKNEEIESCKGEVSSLHKKIKELNWIIDNKRIY
jgi:uncharacterized coiled-coil DUF342 family protein|tara:strand:+ start:179 stop:376 length:198 start_codon:yes stop_codon:yes gene_type:complete